MAGEDVSEFTMGHVPELILVAAGFVMLFIVYAYLRDKEGAGYKVMTAIGVLAGAAMVLILFRYEGEWYPFGTAVIAVAAFTLIIRPFRDTNFAIIIAAMVMLIVWIWLGSLDEPLDVLADGWPRIIVAFVAGAFVYMFLNFAQKLTQLVGKILNLWPVLFTFGVLCIFEGVLVMSGQQSLLDWYRDFGGGAGDLLPALMI